jgi:hypothetical protein
MKCKFPSFGTIQLSSEVEKLTFRNGKAPQDILLNILRQVHFFEEKATDKKIVFLIKTA